MSHGLGGSSGSNSSTGDMSLSATTATVPQLFQLMLLFLLLLRLLGTTRKLNPAVTNCLEPLQHVARLSLPAMKGRLGMLKRPAD